MASREGVGVRAGMITGLTVLCCTSLVPACAWQWTGAACDEDDNNALQVGADSGPVYHVC